MLRLTRKFWFKIRSPERIGCLDCDVLSFIKTQETRAKRHHASVLSNKPSPWDCFLVVASCRKLKYVSAELVVRPDRACCMSYCHAKIPGAVLATHSYLSHLVEFCFSGPALSFTLSIHSDTGALSHGKTNVCLSFCPYMCPEFPQLYPVALFDEIPLPSRRKHSAIQVQRQQNREDVGALQKGHRLVS